jgi:hypothetical protein
MRKLIWCCTAAGVAAAGGLFMAARYTCCHPESLVGRGVATACMGAPILPEIPTPYSACPAESCENEEFPAGAETPAPAPIVIHEDDPPMVERPQTQCPCNHGASEICHHAALCPPAQVDTSDLHGPTPAAYTDEHFPSCPTVMPYCTDEEESAPEELPMPRAAEEGLEHQVFSFWMGWFGMTGPVISETSEPPMDDVPRCEEDLHYFEHYSGVPYTGPCQPPCRKRPSPARPPLKGKGEDDCCEPPQALKIHKAHYNGPPRAEDCPSHPEVDTMEYRRSDGGLNEFGPGPY